MALTARQMRDVEDAAMAGGATGRDLMARAGQGAVEAILAHWPDLAAAPGRALVLCGPGNNGGDGFVVAGLLRDRGWDVEVFLYGEADALPPDARANCQEWSRSGQVRPLTTATWSQAAPLPPADLIVDALFGIGLSRPVDLPLGAVPAGRVVALDMPSGLCSDSGRPVGTAVICADLTLSFHAPKRGHFLADGPAHCGALRIVDIGLGDAVPDAATRLIDRPSGWDKRTGHKYEHGHALVLTGGMARTGAARMSARAALRIGAGLVTLAVPGAAMMECAAQVSALMVKRCDDAAALSAMLEDDRLNALCLGPGLGLDDRASALIATVLDSGRAAVFDADALTLIAGSDALRGRLHDGCVLTPHAGEFARLFPDIARRLQGEVATGPAYSKVDAVRDAADAAGATILLKGPDTVIAAPDGRTAINPAVYERAVPWLATAGAGDVLAGMIAGLLARGLAPFDAAGLGAWLHVEAARSFGPGLIAEDLPEALPQVFARLAGERDGPSAGVP
ncbi:NAD(P)H-hydrate dehydratase [uncultured Jannaschia sp.]|uniref:NAD(P)H-hydrate dehydratase n=1 Tax=uncultured Jannaschia sp. TaxID=293347 RepID=UPI0026029765|nr:NAD(P)H-hydrate dehydratase [uncultured Jannaschia sp.]